MIDHAEPADAVAVAWQASFMEKAQYVIRFFDRALAAEQFVNPAEIAACLGSAGQERRAVELLEMTIDQAERSGTVSPKDILATLRAGLGSR